VVVDAKGLETFWWVVPADVSLDLPICESRL